MAMKQISKSYLLARIEASTTQLELCAMIGMSLSELRALLDYHGIKMKGGTRRLLPPLAEIVRRIEAGEHPASIAAEAGVTTSAVHVAVKKKGLSVADIREGRHLERSRRKGRFGFPDYVFGLRPGHGLGGAK